MNIKSNLLNTGFWKPWLEANRKHAIYHQWQELENAGCIDNFRILAGEKDGYREGWFFADSDAFKWLDAAARVYAHDPAPELEQMMQNFIDLIEKSQAPDGYIYTYNQLLFPDKRWVNLQIEHELYCHGHLIEAGVSHFQATNSQRLLAIACEAADCILAHFSEGKPDQTPGHQEIEIALLRLYEVTHHEPYFAMAQEFIQRRGKTKCFAFKLLGQFINVGKREKQAKAGLKAFKDQHGQESVKILPPTNYAKHWLLTDIRWYLNSLQGKYFQQHQPIEKQVVPVGHSVRFAYLQTASAKLCRLKPNPELQSALEKSWHRMQERRMYVTGGIGSLPAIEGFGRDYELDPEFAYAETCAAIGSIYWNWEMAQLTGKAQYSDLLEWQLYNAALVGMGQDGQCYLYNNPLESHGKIVRREWYEVPCCPSNLTRTWETLQDYILSTVNDTISIHQYFNSAHEITEDHTEGTIKLVIDSQLPYDGNVTLRLDQATDRRIILKLHNPSWTTGFTLSINGVIVKKEQKPISTFVDPLQSEWIQLEHNWKDGDEILINFELPIRLLQAHPAVKGHKGKIALARGPIIYCLESCDQPEVDIFNVTIDPATIKTTPLPEELGAGNALSARSTQGKNLVFIPYHLWANRGETKMTVWVTSK